MDLLDVIVGGLAGDLTDTGPATGRLTTAKGTVASYSGGVLTVNTDYGQATMPRLASYSPTAGDTVLILLINGSPACLGQLV